mgnify:CR=1 FL=1
MNTDKAISINEEQLRRLIPLGTKILVEWELTPDEYGKSGLIRPDQFKYTHYTGIVVRSGLDVVEVYEGDRVFFDQFWGGEKFYFENKRYAILEEDDVLARIDKREVVKT